MTRHVKKIKPEEIDALRKLSKREIIKFLRDNYAFRPFGRPTAARRARKPEPIQPPQPIRISQSVQTNRFE